MQILILGLCLLFTACTSQEPAKPETQGASGSNTSGTVATKGRFSSSLVIAPQDAARGTTFYAIPTNFNFSDVQIAWIVNGFPVSGATLPQFKASEVKRGDIVQASVTGAGFRVESNSVEIKNSPPELTDFNVIFEAKPDGSAYADVAALDPDGDQVTISYEWTKNGGPAGNGQRLSVPLKRGDKISFKAIPFDGIDYGKPGVSEKEIFNMPPVIEENTAYSFDGITYTYQAKASDPDGDPLVYSLAGAPSGMMIDPTTGSVKWVVPPDFKGVAGMTVIVQDGNNGIAQYTLKITMK